MPILECSSKEIMGRKIGCRLKTVSRVMFLDYSYIALQQYTLF